MKKSLWKSAVLAIAAMVTPMVAGQAEAYTSAFDACTPCTQITCDPCGSVGCGSESLWDFGGWIDAGIYSNEYGQENVYNAGQLNPVSGNTTLLQNVRQSDFQVNQLWLYGQKKLSKRGFSVGGRADAVFGTDAIYFQSENLEFGYENANDRWGSGDYYLALPQLYGEVGYDNVSLKVGKFLAHMEYDSPMSSERFFYSTSYSFASMPHTLTGAVATWDVSKKLSVFGGWVCGENKTFEKGDDHAFYGGIEWKAGKRLNLRYTVLLGTQEYEADHPVYADAVRDYFVQSFVADFQMTKRFKYVFEWTLRNETNDYLTGNNDGSYGVNNEFFYELNKKWTIGARFDWMHGYNGGYRFVSGDDDALAFTLGANWKPTKRIMVRPELRYDVFDNTAPFNLTKSGYGDPRDSQLSGGVSVVVKF